MRPPKSAQKGQVLDPSWTLKSKVRYKLPIDYNGLCNRCRWLDYIGPVSNGLENRPLRTLLGRRAKFYCWA